MNKLCVPMDISEIIVENGFTISFLFLDFGAREEKM